MTFATGSGDKIKGKINCIYPQGIILDICEIFYGIANYEECKIKYTSKYLYPKNEMNFKIIEFDEKDMWVKLKPE
jgi:ribosomal protein S1